MTQTEDATRKRIEVDFGTFTIAMRPGLNVICNPTSILWARASFADHPKFSAWDLPPEVPQRTQAVYLDFEVGGPPTFRVHPLDLRARVLEIQAQAQDLVEKFPELCLFIVTHSRDVLGCFNNRDSEVQNEFDRILVWNGPCKRADPLPELLDPDWLAHFQVEDLYGKEFGVPTEPVKVSWR